jgi:hypothetical protein
VVKRCREGYTTGGEKNASSILHELEARKPYRLRHQYIREYTTNSLRKRSEGEVAMTKIITILVLAAILTLTLAVSPAQACACEGVPNWSVMSDEEIVSTINGIKDESRIMDAQRGWLPPAPAGYRYTDNYKLVPLSG